MAKGDITVEGGAGGIIASIEEMEKLATVVGKASEALEQANSQASALYLWRGQAALLGGPKAMSSSPELVAAHANLSQSVDSLMTSPAAPGRCGKVTTDLQGALFGAIDEYEQAEQENEYSLNLLEKAFLFGWDLTGWLGGLGGKISSIMGLASMVGVAAAKGYLEGTSLAETVRKYHEVIREALEQVTMPVPLPGTSDTAKLAGILALMSRILNFPYVAAGNAEIRWLGASTGVMSPNLADLVKGIDFANKEVLNGVPSILVTQVHQPGNGGAKTWVVSLPPTSDHFGKKSPFDVVSDFDSVGFGTNDVVGGLIKALLASGAKKGDKILLAGHSLGGLTAAAAAASPEFLKHFSPPAIITLGSPIATINISPKSPVLAVEHTEDIFVAIGGPGNRNTPNITTVGRSLADSANAAERAAATDPIGAASHGRPYYEETLRLIDQSNDPSIRDFKDAIAPI
ncbi:MAG: hypothetical protein LBH48_07450, partial [Bifidobacteriaceae bacterium]|nr:hypothetical protein [Bifidobacteriaceae bacterium]